MAATDTPLRPLAIYLDRYGEALAAEHCANAQPVLQRSYRWVLIVPAFDEATDFLHGLLKNLNFPSQKNALLVISVINAPLDASAAARARTLKLLAAQGSPATGSLTRVSNYSPGIDVLTVDAVTQPLPADQATGLARKLGNDIACQLMLRDQIKTLLLCNTDADATLPADYFRQIAAASTAERGRPSPGALILPFTHYSKEPAVHAAGQLYELYLRRLYQNLAECGSPYAYPALGSVLAIDPVLYAKSRGFPKRRAGEDFYLLNKIAKLADVVYLAGQPIRLQARASQRVPFGTGPAIEKAMQQPAAGFLTYSPASFALLKRFYAGFRELGQPVDARPSVRGKTWPAGWQDPDLLWLLKRLGLPTVLKKLQANHPGGKAQRRAVHEWFDALKVVRFLNEARHFHPDEALLETTSGQGGLTPESAPEINRELERQRPTSWHGVTQIL